MYPKIHCICLIVSCKLANWQMTYLGQEAMWYISKRHGHRLPSKNKPRCELCFKSCVVGQPLPHNIPRIPCYALACHSPMTHISTANQQWEHPQETTCGPFSVCLFVSCETAVAMTWRTGTFWEFVIGASAVPLQRKCLWISSFPAGAWMTFYFQLPNTGWVPHILETKKKYPPHGHTGHGCARSRHSTPWKPAITSNSSWAYSEMSRCTCSRTTAWLWLEAAHDTLTVADHTHQKVLNRQTARPIRLCSQPSMRTHKKMTRPWMPFRTCCTGTANVPSNGGSALALRVLNTSDTHNLGTKWTHYGHCIALCILRKFIHKVGIIFSTLFVRARQQLTIGWCAKFGRECVVGRSETNTLAIRSHIL